jgi:hypothetical protein
VWVSLVMAAEIRPVAQSVALPDGDDVTGWVLTIPNRRALEGPPSPPPALPEGADRIAPLTIDVLIRREAGNRSVQVLRQTVTRTAERIHMAAQNGREWYFERNPVDPRRVSAWLVDNAAGAIIRYEDTDLRIRLGINGWTDVLALGFDVRLLPVDGGTRNVRTIAGIRFVRYTVPSRVPAARELWWSADQALPSRFAVADEGGVTRFTVERIRKTVDEAVLRPAEMRFPTYQVFDVSGWLER